ncbi:MAG: hypothetical protein MJY89_09085 [Bacteroidales bacterium]|nr:hypothetical protein [Bacteroidales bacterium]
MKYEILNLYDVKLIGMSKKIAFNNPYECQKFWGEYVERIVKPVYLEGKAPDEFQKAAMFRKEWPFIQSRADYQCGMMLPLAD